MYLSKLSYEQKLAFLSISVKIINADGILDKREQNTINSMRIEMGLIEEAKLPTGPLEDILSVFNNEPSKVYAFIEWLYLAYSDEDFSGEEQKLLRAVALIFGFDENKASNLENWIVDYKKHMDKLTLFL
jgi:uncharacterized tellurite resistance protein B-like protein